MLNYFAGGSLVGYMTPGCDVFTVACVCRTPEQAKEVAKQYNQEQANKQKAVKLELSLLGRGKGE